MIMKHPAHPTAKNEYQGTAEAPRVSVNVKEQHKVDMKAFAVRLRQLFLDRNIEPASPAPAIIA
jgi:hypothetical protein